MSPLMHSCLVELCARNRLQSEWGKQIISEQEIELDGQIICVIMDSHVIGSRQSQHSCWSKEDVGRKSRAGSQRICFVMQCSIVRKPREASEIRSADSIFLFYFFVQIPPLLLFPWHRNKMALATRLPLTAWLLFKAKSIQKTSSFDFPSQSQCYEKE